ncbi:methyltransferase domain-containing protein [Massilia sp. PAMC28688]|uniref:methyltransferase domain-containing protein n=1 Tax=Massilia sp. PAMC28688 TaxID=2861283 RepID=UPI001C6260A4|nr:methyltransferase domain-containing protein [Massilia sp. PAMC28688]QYF94730.1 methyltransferase domain-containing protein [Massilia sp. PAMC28688]
MPAFSSRDPLSPGFWDERFEQGFTPWDRGGVPQQLRAFADSQQRPLRTLIPGCGSAYELAYLAQAGWDAVAIDFSLAAVAAARRAVGPWHSRVVEADFFHWTSAQPLELIYERAFLCALPRAMWDRVAARWAELLAPGALLAGYFFLDDAPKGPPFGITQERLRTLMAPHFDCVEDVAVSDSVAVFAGKERWQVWRRNGRPVAG